MCVEDIFVEKNSRTPFLKRGTLWKQLSDQVKKTGQEIPTKDIDLVIELFLIVAKKERKKIYFNVFEIL